ncbi:MULTISPECIES: class I SAM-dependent methyltransferase [unclassified Micromonospora]|uniref:class I SAM-dependent methyltransferase n=1 Tax=unclassified Micromonospora TaxID=2617518 RepID=UPI001B3611EA|nr:MULTISPECIES: class I SAM-dependent methyltransferase [unclassified Micromonospora]MBQ1045916.1 class I SAM-dependent methyltransferase [Micromonospora sp. C72]MBQ1057703.1 class I SAM-dependent methyltransferase [Micromonospora sp. C32]
MNVFGTVADLYERVRPGYPPEIAAAILAYHGGTPTSVVEVGAGTGKGTDVLVRIGAPLTCVEPDALMAARLAERFPDARVEVTTFERWTPPAGGVDVLACAMAWHWLDAATRNALARRALAPGGTLAVFGHRYDYVDAGQRDAVRAALRSVDPTVRERPVDWFHQDVLDSGQFDDVRREVIRRELPLDKEHYLALMSTFGPYLSRTPEQQRRGIAALGRLVDDFGGTIVLDLRTTLVLGRADAR